VDKRFLKNLGTNYFTKNNFKEKNWWGEVNSKVARQVSENHRATR
jgi:hypothetical protein